jgi:hypothetical protein
MRMGEVLHELLFSDYMEVHIYSKYIIQEFPSVDLENS